MFDHTPMNLSTILIGKIIYVFTSEDMENTPPESWM